MREPGPATLVSSLYDGSFICRGFGMARTRARRVHAGLGLLCVLLGCAPHQLTPATTTAKLPQPVTAAPSADPAATDLIGATALIAEITRTEHTEPAATAPAGARVAFRGKLRQFAASAAQLPPDAAAKGWLALFDEFFEVPPSADEYQAKPEDRLALINVVEALPPPASWAALGAAVAARVTAAKGAQGPEDIRNRGLMVIAALLQGRSAEVEAQLAQLEAVLEQREMGGYLSQEVRSLRVALARSAISTPDELEDFMRKSLTLGASRASSTPRIEISDWVTLLGEARARALIVQVLTVKKAQLMVTGARDTRALVKKIVLEKLATLDVAPWSLVDGPDDLVLFEALRKRFPFDAPATGPQGKALFDASRAGGEDEYSLPTAKAAYALGLVARGRADDALKFSVSMSKNDWSRGLSSCLPRTDLNQHGSAFMAFFDKVLERDAEAPVWDTYVMLALASGRGEALLARLQGEREKRTSVAERFLLDRHRAAILWALDRTSEAHALSKALGETPVDGLETEQKLLMLGSEVWEGTRLVTLGRLLDTPGWIDEGLSIVGRAQTQLDALGDRSQVGSMCALLASVKRYKQAERCFADELRAELQKPAAGDIGYRLSNGLEALATMYAEVGRHADVLVLVDQMPQWRIDDVTELGDPKVSVSVAQALLAAGRRDEAVALLQGLVLRNPGADAPYEVLANTVGIELLPWLDRVYARDQFEERPLIWKAYVLLRAGKTEDARLVAKQALRVDPTDGEQPAGDRERGFAVLADVLAAQGAKDDAERYANIVKAVRIAERGDELDEIGLVKRSGETYREGEALAQKAYCIHWRLAERLYALGLLEEAQKHYELAFRYMPEQFGRVAHFCFGCQGVFEKDQSQRVAEQVLTGLSKSTPDNARVFFLLGKLREAQGRAREAYDAFRQALVLDPTYLDALTEISGLRATVLRPAKEWDELQLKLIDVNPTQHAWNVAEVVDLKALWVKLAALQGSLDPVPKALYPFTAAKKAREADRNAAGSRYYRDERELLPTPGQALGQNRTIHAVITLLEHTSHSRMW